MRVRASFVLAAVAGLSSFQTVQTELLRLPVFPPAEAGLGNSLALAGDTLVVGAQTTRGAGGRPEMGAVHVFRRGPTSWREVQVLASPGTEDYEHMGSSVDVSGDRLAVGTLGKGVRLYRFDGTHWVAEQTIAPPAGASSKIFGVFVSLDGDTLAVSDQFEHGRAFRSGATYVYVRTAGGWVLQQRIVPADAAAEDYFGHPVLSGDTLLIGAPGKLALAGMVYAYQRSGSVWRLVQRLTAPMSEPQDFFGARLELEGDTLLVAAPLQDDLRAVGAFPPTRSTRRQGGTIHVYTRLAGFWVPQARLVGPRSVQHEVFGIRMSLRGDLAAVGTSPTLGSRDSRAYLFRRSGARWRQLAELEASDETPRDTFGFSCVLGDGSVLVGAPGQEAGGRRDSGAVYEFRLLGEGVTLVPGLGRNPDALRADAAVLGQLWRAEVGVRAAHRAGAAVLVVSPGTAPGRLVLGGRGEWLLDDRLWLVLGPVPHDGTGSRASISHPVPSNLALLGLPWAAQALVGGARLTPTDAIAGSFR